MDPDRAHSLLVHDLVIRHFHSKSPFNRKNYFDDVQLVLTVGKKRFFKFDFGLWEVELSSDYLDNYRHRFIANQRA